ncbi:hypothetical protein ABK040_014135 [Willaertia magna]
MNKQIIAITFCLSLIQLLSNVLCGMDSYGLGGYSLGVGSYGYPVSYAVNPCPPTVPLTTIPLTAPCPPPVYTQPLAVPIPVAQPVAIAPPPVTVPLVNPCPPPVPLTVPTVPLTTPCPPVYTLPTTYAISYTLPSKGAYTIC